MADRLRGLYAITDSALLPADRLVDTVSHAIAGGAVLVQYRDKQSPPQLRRAQAIALQTLCEARGVPLIINDDLDLAVHCRAAGVHLGREDVGLAEARARLGAGAIIGVSCYADLERARAAAAAGADYLAFGRFFPSETKPEAKPADPELLRAARRELDIPLCAIGGITADNAPLLLEAGADLLAVIHGLFGQPDVRATAARFQALFKKPGSESNFL
jgi:thiamine-phosphate pyrophosphorylase